MHFLRAPHPHRRHHRGLPKAFIVCACMMAIAGCTLQPTAEVHIAPTPTFASTPCWAHLVIDTIPTGAMVALDGVERGVAPIELDLAPGPYQLSATQRGYAPGVVSLDLACGPRAVTIELADNVPPEWVELDAPMEAQQGQPCRVLARAEDPSGVAPIELYLDGALVHESAGAVLEHVLDTVSLSAGNHMLRLVAHDAAGHSIGEERRLQILAPTPTPEPTAEPDPTMAPTPTAEPTVIRQPVRAVDVSWAEITVPTYGYEQALYTDASTGHPYTLLHRDRLTGAEPRTYSILVLRNDYLELIFLPDLGGRIYQCRFLPTGQTLFYNNHVFKPTHWGPADQGWWLAVGGLEFCLPVDEHGYLTAIPWQADVQQREDGSAAVTMSVFEETRHIQADITITLAPGESRFTIDSRLTNTSEQTQSLQYWINAILAPGADSIGPNLRFYYPTDEMIVHSTGDQDLPGAGERIIWPVHAGRNLGHYATWRNWLGVFAPHMNAEYTAVYDHDTRIGMVRVFPYETARGCKLFGFGQGFGDSRAYTDNGSQYIEMWGGWTPTFWDYGDLAAGQTLAWQETWYPISDTDGVSMATGELAASLSRRGNSVVGAVAATSSGTWRMDVVADDQVVTQQTLALDPATTASVELPLPEGNTGVPWAVRIVDQNGNITLEQALGGQER